MTCGANIFNNINLIHATDGAACEKVDPDVPDLNMTENTLAPKDVVLVVAHGLCVLNGATAALIKCGKN